MFSNHSSLTGTSLHEAFHYVSGSDPGAVGAGLYWLDTSADPYVLKRRNGTDDGWVTVGGAGGGRTTLYVEGDGINLANSAAETALFNTGSGHGSLAIAANTLKQWDRVHVEFYVPGLYTTTPADSIIIRIYLESGSPLYLQLNPLPDGFNGYAYVNADFLIKTDGASGTFAGVGRVDYYNYLDNTSHFYPTSVSGSIDTTAINTMNVTGEWYTADPANRIDLSTGDLALVELIPATA